MLWKKLFKSTKSEDFKCPQCGQIHSGWPALTFDSPSPFYDLTDEEKNNIAEIGTDFCIINHPEQTDRFIRVTMTQKVNNSEENLDYGIWVSLSEENFNDYYNNFDNDTHEMQYFGWICSRIPDYDSCESIPTTVITQKGNQRPKIFPHENFNHNLVKDFYEGISAHEAQRRVDEMLNKNDG